MMLTWEFVGIIGLVAIAECWGLAVVLYRVGAPGTAARALSWVMVAEGAALFTSGVPEAAIGWTRVEAFFTENPQFMEMYIQGSFILHALADAAMVALYPAFLALALNTKLTRLFAGKSGRVAAAFAALTMFVLVQITPLRIGATVLYISLSSLFGFALVASIHAWRMAEPGTARTRAGIFASAFGLRDICWGIVYAGSIWLIWHQAYSIEATTETALDLPIKLIYVLGTLLAVPIIGYGILRTHLFDIDLRIRWTIKQSTVGAAVVGIMFILSEGAEVLLSEEFGTIGGISGAVLGLLLLSPIKRFAERLASKAMPNTHNTPEYASKRKLQVYESALSEAWFDGGLSDKERNLLTHLRESMGISAADADAIEAQLQARTLSYG